MWQCGQLTEGVFSPTSSCWALHRRTSLTCSGACVEKRFIGALDTYWQNNKLTSGSLCSWYPRKSKYLFKQVQLEYFWGFMITRDRREAIRFKSCYSSFHHSMISSFGACVGLTEKRRYLLLLTVQYDIALSCKQSCVLFHCQSCHSLRGGAKCLECCSNKRLYCCCNFDGCLIEWLGDILPGGLILAQLFTFKSIYQWTPRNAEQQDPFPKLLSIMIKWCMV